MKLKQVIDSPYGVIIVALIIAGCFAVMGIYGQPVATAPVSPAASLRQIVTATSNATIHHVTAPHTVIDDIEYRGWKGPGIDGRCLVIAAPFARVNNVRGVAGNDDTFCVISDSHGTVLLNCEAMTEDWTGSKAIVAYTGASSALPGPMFGADVGFAAQIIGGRFQGSQTAGRFRDGVWNLVDDDIYISNLAGLDLTDPCRMNVINCRFHRIPKPAAAPWWNDNAPPIRLARRVNGKLLQTSLRSRLYIANCTINNQPATPSQLVPGVPSYVFRASPN